MKILSFDVGIKNLAYCLIDDQHYAIEDWGVINISVDPICSHCNKQNGKQCDKTAKFVCDNDFFLCSTHKLQKTYKNKKFNSVKKSKNPILELGINMIKKLDEKDNLLNVNTVLIENQPALKNPTMKTIQMILYSYFLINGLTNNLRPIQNIEMINARNKLKAYKGPPIECNIKDKYKRTKFLAIEYCKIMLQENINIENKYKEMFHESKKQDDLSDSYLQGIYWIIR